MWLSARGARPDPIYCPEQLPRSRRRCGVSLLLKQAGSDGFLLARGVQRDPLP